MVFRILALPRMPFIYQTDEQLLAIVDLQQLLDSLNFLP